MIIETTPEIAEGLFEHLLIMNINDFDMKVSKHKLIDEKTKVYFTVENISEDLQDKIANLIDLYNQLIPDQKTNLATKEDLNNTQNFWIPVKDFSIGFGPDANIRIKRAVGFGIGLHPSTILMLRALEKSIQKKYENFIDVGSGSGILSMYAAKNGIKNIIAFEIQDEANITMKENFYFNNLDSAGMIFNPYLTEENKKEDIRDYREVLKITNETTLDKIDSKKSLYAANMRPKELEMCKDILSYSKDLIISGLMNEEENKFSKNDSKELKFGEWKCSY